MLSRKEKAPVSPSPFFLALLIGLAALGIGLALFVLAPSGGSTPAPQPAAALAPATATAASSPTPCVPEDEEDDSCYDLTPTRVVAADTPIGPTATQPPLPALHTPGPTAQFTQLLPLEQWRTYTNEWVGYSIKYPPDWYVIATTPDTVGVCCSTTFYSYDPYDMRLEKGPPPPPNFIKLEVGVSDLTLSPGESFQPGESVAEWRRRTRPADFPALEERDVTIAGIASYLEVTALDGKPKSVVIVVPLSSSRVLSFIYPAKPPGIFSRTLQRMINNFKFVR